MGIFLGASATYRPIASKRKLSSGVSQVVRTGGVVSKSSALLYSSLASGAGRAGSVPGRGKRETKRRGPVRAKARQGETRQGDERELTVGPEASLLRAIEEAIFSAEV